MRRFDKGGRGFLQWIKAHQPQLYRAISGALKSEPSLRGLGLAVPASDLAAQTPASAATPSWVQSIKELALAAAQTYLTREQLSAQRRVLDMQLQRAAQGQPPLDIDLAQYGLTPTASVGLAPDTRTLVTWGAIGLGLVYLLPKLLRRA